MKYDNPFPGMNPYLEHPDIWPDFHFSLVAGLATALGPRLPHNYRIDLQRRVEVEEPSAGGSSVAETVSVVAAPPDEAVAVRVRMPREVGVSWLRVETVPERELVTIVEVLSPTNKRPGEGRRRYIRKREAIVAGLVNLVEIDLLRRWEPMPLETPPPASDYRILVCRSLESPGAWLYPFMVRQRIPKFTLPLRSDDEAPAPEVDLGPIINALHHTARYGQIARYDAPPPEPAFEVEVAEWVGERVAGFVVKA